MATKKPYQAVLDDKFAAHDFEPVTVTLNRHMVDVCTDEDGNFKLIFSGAKLDFCPDVLHADVNKWCERTGVSYEILVDAMLRAAAQEAALANIRQALVLKP